MSGSRHIPERTCIGCGQRAPQALLVRIGIDGQGQLILRNRQVSGRSAYLHRARDCWQRFADRKGMVRSLGRSIDKQQRKAFVGSIELKDGGFCLAEVTTA